MISSEVQRTLVKSPPELWAELSEPESLARHLGELGEIAITRTEPESLVEWEAQGTTGKVEIKASGWGTKVTLSVCRELPEPAPESTACGEAEARPPEQAVQGEAGVDVEQVEGAALQRDEAGEEQVEGAAQQADEAGAPETQAEQPSPVSAVAVEEQDALAGKRTEPIAPLQSAQVTPGPITAAARSAAGWPSRQDGRGPSSTPSEAQPADGASETNAPVEVLREAEKPAASAEPAPPRGFFARLFGRRRPSPASQTPTEPASQAREVSEHSTEEAYGIADALPIAPQQPPEPREPIGGQPAETSAGSPMAGEPEPGAVENAAESPAPTAATGEPERGAMEDAIEPPAATDDPAPSPHPTELSAATTDDPAPSASRIAGGPPAASAGAEDPASEPASTSLQEELRAAEEVAEEEVRAVLVAVLDRLGAAHHRPFSRA